MKIALCLLCLSYAAIAENPNATRAEIKITNIEDSSEIVQPRPLKGALRAPDGAGSRLDRIDILTSETALMVKISGPKAKERTISIPKEFQITSAIWTESSTVLFVRKFYFTGSPPFCIIRLTSRDEEAIAKFIPANYREEGVMITNIIGQAGDRKGDHAKVEAAIGKDKYRYVHGDIDLSALPAFDDFSSIEPIVQK